VLRFVVGLALRRVETGFPLATFLVNLSGCFAIGLVAGLLPEDRPAPRLFWITGVLGGYTTFSTFGYETHALIRDGSLTWAALNAGGQVALGLLGVTLGLTVAKLARA
jgi:CrcB protein